MKLLAIVVAVLAVGFVENVSASPLLGSFLSEATGALSDQTNLSLVSNLLNSVLDFVTSLLNPTDLNKVPEAVTSLVNNLLGELNTVSGLINVADLNDLTKCLFDINGLLAQVKGIVCVVTGVVNSLKDVLRQLICELLKFVEKTVSVVQKCADNKVTKVLISVLDTLCTLVSEVLSKLTIGADSPDLLDASALLKDAVKIVKSLLSNLEKILKNLAECIRLLGKVANILKIAISKFVCLVNEVVDLVEDFGGDIDDLIKDVVISGPLGDLLDQILCVIDGLLNKLLGDVVKFGNLDLKDIICEIINAAKELTGLITSLDLSKITKCINALNCAVKRLLRLVRRLSRYIVKLLTNCTNAQIANLCKNLLATILNVVKPIVVIADKLLKSLVDGTGLDNLTDLICNTLGGALNQLKKVNVDLIKAVVPIVGVVGALVEGIVGSVLGTARGITDCLTNLIDGVRGNITEYLTNITGVLGD